MRCCTRIMIYTNRVRSRKGGPDPREKECTSRSPSLPRMLPPSQRAHLANTLHTAHTQQNTTEHISWRYSQPRFYPIENRAEAEQKQRNRAPYVRYPGLPTTSCLSTQMNQHRHQHHHHLIRITDFTVITITTSHTTSPFSPHHCFCHSLSTGPACV
jgi:hypothetical protein